jgi:membrane-associated phospholipid phosphatase
MCDQNVIIKFKINVKGLVRMHSLSLEWRRTLFAASACVAAFVLLPFVAFMGGRSLPIDRLTTDLLHGHATPWLTSLLKFVSTYAYHPSHWWIIGAAGLGFLVFRRSLWETLILIAVRYGADLAQESIKSLYARPRPLLAWVKPSSSFSYPSGTVTVGAALCLALAYTVAYAMPSRKGRAAVISAGWAAAVLIAISRIYLGAHWLTDTIGALALAGLIVCLATAPLRLRRRNSAAELPMLTLAPQANVAISKQN